MLIEQGDDPVSCDDREKQGDQDWRRENSEGVRQKGIVRRQRGYGPQDGKHKEKPEGDTRDKRGEEDE